MNGKNASTIIGPVVHFNVELYILIEVCNKNPSLIIQTMENLFVETTSQINHRERLTLPTRIP